MAPHCDARARSLLGRGEKWPALSGEEIYREAQALSTASESRGSTGQSSAELLFCKETYNTPIDPPTAAKAKVTNTFTRVQVPVPPLTG